MRSKKSASYSFSKTLKYKGVACLLMRYTDSGRCQLKEARRCCWDVFSHCYAFYGSPRFIFVMLSWFALVHCLAVVSYFKFEKLLVRLWRKVYMYKLKGVFYMIV